MTENLKWIALATGVVALFAAAFIYFSPRFKQAVPTELPTVVAPEPPPVAEEPAIKHPVAAPAEPEPLPKLDESDSKMSEALAGVVGQLPVEQFLIPQNLVRNIVVTVDNLPEAKLAERLRPVRPAPGRFVAGGSEDAPTLDPANYDRYKPLVEMIRSTDNQKLVAAYSRYYPLFQQAYADLGHPPEYFNDRLVEVIDHLLATPEVKGPIALARPGVQYEFADPGLEGLSSGQKIMIRMGTANATAIKEKLRELRAALVERKPGG